MAPASERGPAGATRDGRARAAQPAVRSPGRASRQVSEYAIGGGALQASRPLWGAARPPCLPPRRTLGRRAHSRPRLWLRPTGLRGTAGYAALLSVRESCLLIDKKIVCLGKEGVFFGGSRN